MSKNELAFREALLLQISRTGIELAGRRADLLVTHYRLLCKWNPRLRLVSSIDPVRAATEHYLDSLILDRFIDDYASSAGPPAGRVHRGGGDSMIDIGAGAGFPGIPLKVLHPGKNLTIIESHAKKISFLKAVKREINLGGILVIRGRAEDAMRRPELREQFDIAFCRAVASPGKACELALPFLRSGGKYLAQTADIEENPSIAAALGRAARLGGARLVESVSYELPDHPRSRSVSIVIKNPTNAGREPEKLH